MIGDLPSADAANALLAGKPGALGEVIGTTLGRALLIGAGLYLVGGREKPLVKNALAGALAIEVFVLCYLSHQQKAAPR